MVCGVIPQTLWSNYPVLQSLLFGKAVVAIPPPPPPTPTSFVTSEPVSAMAILPFAIILTILFLLSCVASVLLIHRKCRPGSDSVMKKSLRTQKEYRPRPSSMPKFHRAEDRSPCPYSILVQVCSNQHICYSSHPMSSKSIPINL